MSKIEKNESQSGNLMVNLLITVLKLPLHIIDRLFATSIFDAPTQPLTADQWTSIAKSARLTSNKTENR